MSGYCPECGNTLCICSEYEKATYPLRREIESLRKELDRARVVIEFYADRDNWDDDKFSPTIWDDGNIDLGRRAFSFLNKYPDRGTGEKE